MPSRSPPVAFPIPANVFAGWSGWGLRQVQPAAARHGGNSRAHLRHALRLDGNSRAFLIANSTAGEAGARDFERVDLRGKTLRMTVDVSHVPCSCNAALYLVRMSKGPTSNYCDIQSVPSCTELDLLEANTHAVQSTVHTSLGLGGDGSCNQWGCAVNWGNWKLTAGGQRTRALFGPGGLIDSRQPFVVEAALSEAGVLSVLLEQEGSRLPFFNQSSASNPATGSCAGKCAPGRDPPASSATGLPLDSNSASAAANAEGMVLVASLWGAPDMARWLDAECPAAARSGVASASATFSALSIEVTPPSPTAPPPSAPPSPPPPPPSPFPARPPPPSPSPKPPPRAPPPLSPAPPPPLPPPLPPPMMSPLFGTSAQLLQAARLVTAGVAIVSLALLFMCYSAGYRQGAPVTRGAAEPWAGRGEGESDRGSSSDDGGGGSDGGGGGSDGGGDDDAASEVGDEKRSSEPSQERRFDGPPPLPPRPQPPPPPWYWLAPPPPTLPSPLPPPPPTPPTAPPDPQAHAEPTCTEPRPAVAHAAPPDSTPDYTAIAKEAVLSRVTARYAERHSRPPLVRTARDWRPEVMPEPDATRACTRGESPRSAASQPLVGDLI